MMQKAIAPPEDVLCAGGTLSITPLSAAASAGRVAEMALLYVAAPFAVDRATIAVALGTSVAVAYLAVTSGALALPALDDDE